MTDTLGRSLDYLRISVTDRCSFRCVYCMPEEGVEPLGHEDVLRFDEILRVAEAAADLGITKIKLTGGEPLVRRGIGELTAMLKKIPGITSLTMTTNGEALDKHLLSLYEGGLTGLNLSLDTLDPAVFKSITRRDSFEKVYGNLKEALAFGKIPLKLNAVLLTEEQDFVSLAALAKRYPLPVRFIEIMPVGLGNSFPGVKPERVKALLEEAYGPLSKTGNVQGNGPAEYYSLPGFAGPIGFISAVSHGFCESCNRLRLTAEGKLMPCLAYDRGIDLKPLLRSGGDREALQAAFLQAAAQKPRGHRFSQSGGEEKRLMNQIGG